MAQLEKYNLQQAEAIIAHVERTGTTHSGDCINPNLTQLNYNLWPPKPIFGANTPGQSSGRSAWQRLEKRLSEISHTERDGNHVLCDWRVYLASNPPPSYESPEAFFKSCVQSICKLYGAENVVYAAVHVDEEIPHIHIGFVPVVTNRQSVCEESVGVPTGEIEQPQIETPTYEEKAEVPTSEIEQPLVDAPTYEKKVDAPTNKTTQSLVEKVTKKKSLGMQKNTLVIVGLILVILILLLRGCSGSGGKVPNSIATEEFDNAYDISMQTKSDSFKIKHDVNRRNKTDTVTYIAKFDNDFVTSTYTLTSVFQYDHGWYCANEGDWEREGHIKDFIAGRSGPTVMYEEFYSYFGRKYVYLEIYKDGIDVENNTIYCKSVYVEEFTDTDFSYWYEAHDVTLECYIRGGSFWFDFTADETNDPWQDGARVYINSKEMLNF